MARVLIVDDEPDILLLLRMTLEGAGHETLMAADGEMALRRIDDDTPELVLLDVMMPVMDGWGVLERLREREAAPPVIVVSAMSRAQDASRAMELGAVEYLTKPIDFERLLPLVEEAVRTGGPSSR